MNHNQWLVAGVTLLGFIWAPCTLMAWVMHDEEDRPAVVKGLKWAWLGWAVIFGPFVLLSWVKALVE